MPIAAVTAEWICTRCGSTNRRLVPTESAEAADRCITCHAKHLVSPGERPVRWEAKLAG
ncbi:MAG: hypothetical protein ACHQXA_03870 [Gemmatimonadales bacterium]|jgi:DNA-directed RNA polymerase subunit RPC12/RpoP